MTLLTDSPSKDAAKSAPSKREYLRIANKYARDVVAKKIPACWQVIAACQRYLNDLERQKTDEFEFQMDRDSATRACEFLEALPHVKGKWAKKRETLTLEPWQCFIVVNLFGWVEKADPTRYRFREADIYIPRKNGKSFLAAGIALYKFCADGEYAAEVYFGATSLEQSKRLGFKMARAMVLRSPELQKAFGLKVNVNSIVKNDDGSILKPVIAKPGDGDMPSCAVTDEYHEHPTSELVDTFKTGMGARESPLDLKITTAGSNRGGPAFLLQKDLEQILRGTMIDERVFAIIYTIDDGDDPFCEASLRKANPNWGTSIEPQFLLDEMNAARQSARKQNAYKTKYLNIWVNAAVGWMNMVKWDALADTTLRIEQFEKQPCLESIDIASRLDIASKVRVFQRKIDGKDHYYVFANHYLNQAAVDEGRGEHYATWAEDGWLIVTPGNITDYLAILEDLIAGSFKYRICGIPYDPSHSDLFVQAVEKDPRWNRLIEFIECPQNTGNFSPAMKDLEALVFEGRIHHDGDPVLAWMMSNVIAISRPHDCIVPDKEHVHLKIDGAVALIMAIGHAARLPKYTSSREVICV